MNCITLFFLPKSTIQALCRDSIALAIGKLYMSSPILALRTDNYQRNKERIYLLRKAISHHTNKTLTISTLYHTNKFQFLKQIS